MFEIESKAPDEVTLKTKAANVKFDLVEQTVDGDLPVGKIEGPGEFEIGDMAIRGIQTGEKTVYDVIMEMYTLGLSVELKKRWRWMSWGWRIFFVRAQ